MAKGAWVQEQVKQEVARIYLEAQDKGDNLRAKEVHRALTKRLHERGQEQFMISLRAVQQILTDIRKREQARSVDEQSLDKPWSLGESVRHYIPPEANDDLLKIWKFCRIMGRKFTIREAQWVARLGGVVPPKSLFYWAILYALKERLCLSLGQGFDTTYLDACLAFGSPSERNTAEFTSVLEEKPVFMDPSVLDETQREFVAEEIYLFTRDTEPWTEPHYLMTLRIMREDFKRQIHQRGVVAFPAPESERALETKLERMGRQFLETMSQEYSPSQGYTGIMTTVPLVALSPEAKVVYALWLRKISTTDVWRSQSFEQHLKIMQELYELMKSLPGEGVMRSPTAPIDPSWKPTEILRRYGLE